MIIRTPPLVENNVNIALYCFLPQFNQKKTGCDEYVVRFPNPLVPGTSIYISVGEPDYEYVEDLLNVASKNPSKYPFDEKYSKKYLEDICSMEGWSNKKAILNFFLGMT